MGKHIINIVNGKHLVAGSYGWSYVADESTVYFGSTNHENYFVANGNFIGKDIVVDLCGKDSHFCGEMKAPKNELKHVLWENGFYNVHRVSYGKEFYGQFDPDVESWNRYVNRTAGHDDNDMPAHSVRRWELVDTDGNLLVAAASGIVDWEDKCYCAYWLSPLANRKHAIALTQLLKGQGIDKTTGSPSMFFREIKTVEADQLPNVTVISKNTTEQNPFANERTCHNGGGYFQPLTEILCVVGEKRYEVVISDTSCGDFGSRLSVCIRNDHPYHKTVIGSYWYNTMDGKYEEESSLNISNKVVRALLKAKILKEAWINFGA